MTQPAPLLDVINLKTHFTIGTSGPFGSGKQTLKAVDGISFEIRSGEVLSLVGESGCGKTTFLRAIAGLDIQTAGTIEQAGRDISNLPPAERDFGIVFQSYALFPNLNVNRNIAYGLENAGGKKAAIEGRVNELLELVGLPDQGDKYPAQLSGGQQQRLCIARTIAIEPKVILMDEPCSALDPIATAVVEELIDNLRKDFTIVIVTHSMQQAARISQRTAFFHLGNLVEVGDTKTVFTNPREERTQN